LIEFACRRFLAPPFLVSLSASAAASFDACRAFFVSFAVFAAGFRRFTPVSVFAALLSAISMPFQFFSAFFSAAAAAVTLSAAEALPFSPFLHASLLR